MERSPVWPIVVKMWCNNSVNSETDTSFPCDNRFMIPKLLRALSAYEGLQICASHPSPCTIARPSPLWAHTQFIRFALVFPLQILRSFELTFFFWQTVLTIINPRHIYLLHSHHTTNLLSKQLNCGNGRTLFKFFLFISYFFSSLSPWIAGQESIMTIPA